MEKINYLRAVVEKFKFFKLIHTKLSVFIFSLQNAFSYTHFKNLEILEENFKHGYFTNLTKINTIFS